MNTNSRHAARVDVRERRRAENDARGARIMTAAARVFARRGVENATMEMIEHSPTGAVPHTPTYQDALKRLYAAQKKARAWDAYEALHTRTLQALADDFDSVFGKAFARAYERSLQEVSAKDRG